MRITVFGTGYLGAVHAAGMAEFGHNVVAVDVDHSKIEALADGVSPFYEPGYPELLLRNLDTGRLRFTTSTAEAVAHGDVHFICVGTPQDPGSMRADLTYVDAVAEEIRRGRRADCLVVGKSTVPVGTAERLGRLLSGNRAAKIRLAWNPEFLREGFAVADTLTPDRLVLGVADDESTALLREVYAPVFAVGTPCVVTDLATAELTKVAANAFLATKISYINAMAELCERTGADVVDLADAIGMDERIGRRFLNAGVGFGGGCLGKDIRAFRARSREVGCAASLAFLDEVDAINSRRRAHVVNLSTRLLGGDVDGRRIAVLGAAFKPNSDDIRDSPALWVAQELARLGARIRIHDPEALGNVRSVAHELDAVDDVAKAVEGSVLTIHLTEWSTYREIDPAELADLASGRVLIDARNALDRAAWNAAGWHVHALGRPSLPAQIS